MSRYRKKPETVDAVQWRVPFVSKKAPQWFLEALLAPAGSPLRIWSDDNGTLQISTPRGAILRVNEGSWLVHQDGDVAVFEDKDFKKRFSPVGRKGWDEIVNPADPTDKRDL